MIFDPPLIPARLVRRYKRFLADMQLADGRTVVAHCPNPGSMLGNAEPGAKCWLQEKTGKSRKLDFGWELVESGKALVGINTGLANRIVGEALAVGQIAELPKGGTWRAEAAFGTGTRFDFLHEDEAGKKSYLEVKSVTLSRRQGLAEFPDAKTARGAKHLAELMSARAQGCGAFLLFLVERGDCLSLSPAADIDPVYASVLGQAAAAGVGILAYACDITPIGISLAESMPIKQ